MLADATTSVLVIVVLLAGRFYGWSWLDPMMGIVGAVVMRVLRPRKLVTADFGVQQEL